MHKVNKSDVLFSDRDPPNPEITVKNDDPILQTGASEG